MAEEHKSKTRIKQEMKELQLLGKRLVELQPERLAALPLDDPLREAIVLAQGIRAHGGRKRQIKYIGKLLRSRDTTAILQALDSWREEKRRAAAMFRRVERWRDRLLEEGDKALEELCDQFPHAERQPIRTLIRNARREAGAGHPPVAARALFRHLRDLMET